MKTLQYLFSTPIHLSQLINCQNISLRMMTWTVPDVPDSIMSSFNNMDALLEHYVQYSPYAMLHGNM